MHAVSTNQIADIFHFNNKLTYHERLPFLKSCDELQNNTSLSSSLSQDFWSMGLTWC